MLEKFMPPALIARIQKFEYKSKGQLFLKMIADDGGLSLVDILTLEQTSKGSFQGLDSLARDAGRTNPVEELLASFSATTELFDDFRASPAERRQKKEENKQLIARFLHLPIQQRLEQCEERYLNKFPLNSDNYKRIQKQNFLDKTFMYAVHLMIKTYVETIYDLNITTAKQLEFIAYLKPDKHHQISKIQEVNARAAVQEFAKLYTFLNASGLPEDKMASSTLS